MNTDIRILHLEDEAAEVVLVGHELHRAGLRFKSKHVDNRETFLQEILEHPPDVILSDHNLPSFDGFAALALAREWCPDVPFIFVTGGASEQVAAQAVKNGAAGYVLKDHMEDLAPTVQRALQEAIDRTSSRRAEQEARSAEARYRGLIETCPDAFFVIWTTGDLAFVNNAAVRLLRADDADQVMRRPAMDLFDAGGWRRILERIFPVYDPGAWPPHLHEILVRQDESRVEVELSITSMVFATRSAALVVAREITRPAPMEGVSSKMEALREVILDTTLDGVVSIDHQGLVHEWNPAAHRILGYSRDEAMGRPWDELIRPAELRVLDHDQHGLAQNLATGGGDPQFRHIETTLHRRDGSEFPAELAICQAPTDEQPFCTVLIRDLSRRTQAGAARIQGDEPFRRLVDGVEDFAIFQLDADGRVATWNPGAERIYGYRAEEIIGSPFTALFTAEDNEKGLPATVISRARDEGKDHDEGWRARKDGSRFLGLSILTALRDEAGVVRGFAVVAQDVTAQRQAEEEIWRHNDDLERRVAEHLAQLEAAKREMDVFSYSVSYELRWPLRHIIRFAESLQNRMAAVLDEQSQSDMRMIAEGGRQMDRLIDAVLSYSRVGQAELRPDKVSLKSLVDQARTLLSRESEGRRIEWHIEEMPEVKGDAALLQQAMVELLSNALKFTRTRETAEVHVGAKTEADETVVFVRDNGVGFDMQYVGRLFNVFQRLHPTAQFEGAGIGLANVRRIINRHHGRTWAEGTVDGGATFFFGLPNPRDAAA